MKMILATTMAVMAEHYQRLRLCESSEIIISQVTTATATYQRNINQIFSVSTSPKIMKNDVNDIDGKIIITTSTIDNTITIQLAFSDCYTKANKHDTNTEDEDDIVSITNDNT